MGPRDRVIAGRCLAAVLAVVVLAPLAPVVAQDLELERVVLLSRHGVRSPTQPLAELDRHVATPWTRWPVEPGFLTPRGAELMTRMGSFYRDYYVARGLLPASACPPAGMVTAWADVDQRTRLTAQAILDGLYPGCRLAAGHQADLKAVDRLFHPTRKGGVCAIEPDRARAAVLERIGSFETLLAAYAEPLAATQAILCPPDLSRGKPRCGLAADRAAIESRHDGGVAMKGPIATASTAVEIFVLETAQGFAGGQVAWGRLRDDAALRDLMVLHTLQFDLMDRTPYLAARGGSNLLASILGSLEDDASGARFELLAGHDTNIANIAGLLGLSWIIPGFQPNQASPGGAIAFEVLRERTSGQRYVKLAYLAQTLQQMRSMAVLDRGRPPGISDIDLPGCADPARGNACPIKRFAELARATLEPACVAVK